MAFSRTSSKKRLQIFERANGKQIIPWEKGGYYHLIPTAERATKVSVQKSFKAYETNLFADVERTRDGNFHILQTLDAERRNLKNWSNDKKLWELPILAHDYITPEERHWTGERTGNFTERTAAALAYYCGGGVWLVLALTSILFRTEYFSVQNIALAVAVFAILISIISIKSTFSKKGHREDLTQLQEHKRYLIETLKRQKSLPERFSKRHKSLPERFRKTNSELEKIISLKLQKEGHRIKKIMHLDKYKIQLESKDPCWVPTITHIVNEGGAIPAEPVEFLIKEKGLSKNNMRCLLFSLQGFSHDARMVAFKNGIELREVDVDR